MGSRRSPIWSGGATVFGPRTRDFGLRTSKAVRQLALRRAITLRVADGDVLSTPSFEVADGKTKSFVALVAKLAAATKVLIVGTGFSEMTFRSARNVANVQLVRASDVTSEQLLNYEKVVMTTASLQVLANRTA
jgi:large subunit ribosomal protein L4